ncbi:MAG: universal stress protein [Anaerolineae bacterium]|nr:universal stress protein [Anaerolineae bacterium]
MFGKVLFPTDFSAYANTVFACLPDLKAIGVGMVVLVNVIRSNDVPMPETINQESLNRVRWSIQEQLNIAQMALEGHDLRVNSRIEYGSVSEQIVKVATEERVDLIVVGAQGKTLSEELLLGSTAYSVLRQSAVPVLVLKANVVRDMGHVKCKGICSGAFSHILHPTDFSECATRVFQIVRQLKSCGVEEVVLLHVQDERALRHISSEQLSVFDLEDTERLKQMSRALSLKGIGSRLMLRHGHPVREIVRASEEEEVSLLVIGTRGRSAIQEILAGSTAENVIRLARCPVLAIPCSG